MYNIIYICIKGKVYVISNSKIPMVSNSLCCATIALGHY